MAEGELDAEMVAVAKAIIPQRTGGFDPTTYRDRYQDALRELIEAKMKGLTETMGTCGAVANRLDRRCHLGQIYPVPAGFLKQSTEGGERTAEAIWRTLELLDLALHDISVDLEGGKPKMHSRLHW